MWSCCVTHSSAESARRCLNQRSQKDLVSTLCMLSWSFNSLSWYLIQGWDANWFEQHHRRKLFVFVLTLDCEFHYEIWNINNKVWTVWSVDWVAKQWFDSEYLVFWNCILKTRVLFVNNFAWCICCLLLRKWTSASHWWHWKMFRWVSSECHN